MTYLFFNRGLRLRERLIAQAKIKNLFQIVKPKIPLLIFGSTTSCDLVQIVKPKIPLLIFGSTTSCLFHSLWTRIAVKRHTEGNSITSIVFCATPGNPMWDFVLVIGSIILSFSGSQSSSCSSRYTQEGHRTISGLHLGLGVLFFVLSDNIHCC